MGTGSARKIDERRDFNVAGHRTWAFRVVSDDSGETEGIVLKILPPFRVSPREYFTSDGGTTFCALQSYFATNDAGLVVGEAESAPEILTILKNAFVTWQRASGFTEKRERIVALCQDYRGLFASLPKTDTQSFSARITRIQRETQSIPDDQLKELDDALEALFAELRRTDAEDGKKILEPERHMRFLSAHS
jgi:hypothetical protein